MRITKLIIILLSAIFINASCYSQGILPPGWDTFSVNPTCETIIIFDNIFPTIDGEIIQNGDYIGAFFNHNGQMKCGGAKKYEYGKTNTITIYGDDSFTDIKDGFHTGDSIYWIVFQQNKQTETNVFVEYQSDVYYYSHSGRFVPDGIAALSNISADDFRVYTYISAYNSCKNADSLITASCAGIGGSGNYSYSWSSEPEGITGSTPEISFTIDETKLLKATVTDLDNNFTTNGYTCHFIIEPPIIYFTHDTIVRANNTIALNANIIGDEYVTWTTSGDGYFNDFNSHTPTYYPGQQDFSDKHVLLTVKAFSLAPCYDTTTHHVNVSFTNDGISDNSYNIAAHPNPFYNKLIININEPQEVLIYNTFGKIIKQFFSEDNVIEIETSGWNKGVYIIKTKKEHIKTVKI